MGDKATSENFHSNWSGSFWLRIVAASLSPLAGAFPARAQTEAARVYPIVIAAKPLPQAVADLSARTGLQVLYTGSQAFQRTSQPVNGTYAPEQALRIMLQGTGITYRFVRPNAVTLEVPRATTPVGAAPAGAIPLDTITVEGGRPGVVGVVASQARVGAKSTIPIAEVPQSISVVTRDELDKRGVEDFNTAVAYTPGVRVIDYPGGQGAPDIYLRGFRAINFLGLYQDGLRAGFNSYDQNVEPYGIERIEVLKGPASVLYGQGAPGGLINLVSKRPTDTAFGEIQLQGGTYNRLQGAFDLGGPVNPDKTVLYRLTGLVRDSDTQLAYTPDDRIFIAPSVTIKPNDQTTFTLLSNYSRFRRGGSEQSLPISGTLLPNPLGQISRNLFLGEPGWNREVQENKSIGYVFDHAFTDRFRFHSASRYTNTASDYDTIGASSSGALLNNRFYRRLPQMRRQSAEMFVTDNNLEWGFDTFALSHKLVVGFDYGNYSRKENRRNGAIAALDIFNPVYGSPITWAPNLVVNTRSDLAQTGLYAQDQIKFDRFIASAGVRQDLATSRVTNFLTNRVDSRQDRALSYRLGLSYQFDNGLTPYVGYSTSFNPQSFNRSDGQPFDPARGKQWEAGVKYQPPGTDTFVTASVFDIRQTNMPAANQLNPGFFDQTGEVRVRGVELEGKANLAPGFDVIASLAYLDAIVTKGPPSLLVKVGNRVATVPDWTGSIWANYTFQNGFADGLRLGGGLRYVGDTTDATNVDHIPGYLLVDLSLNYDLGKLRSELKGFSVNLTVNNLFDKQYYTPSFYTGTVLEGSRRTVLGSLTYRW